MTSALSIPSLQNVLSQSLFNTDLPAWHLRSVIFPAFGPQPHIDMENSGDGIILIPSRPKYKIRAALEAGDLLLLREYPKRNGAPQLAIFHADDPSCCLIVACNRGIIPSEYVPTDPPSHSISLTASLQTDSFLDPSFHQTWVTIHELMSLPWLRNELFAARDYNAVLRILDFNDTESTQ
jgi:hypothetical protein